MLTARTTASVLAVLTIFLVSLNLSLVLLKNYSGYNVNPSLRPCKEVQIYNETLDYLESTGAEKIYSTNPILPALSTKLNSSTAFDTYALLLLEQKPPQEIMDNLVNEDVDFVLFDASFRDLVKPYYKQATELMTMVRDNSLLVKTMEPNSSCRIEIYRLGADTTGIFNGDFELWGSDEEMRFPLGWEHVLVKGEGDIANISEEHIAGKRCVELKIYEDGEKNETSDYIYAGITQKIDFPKGIVRVQVLPKVNTDPSTRYQLSPGIHFIDEGGHSLVVGFSDRVKDENIFEHEGGYRMLVLKEAQLNEWKEQAIDLAGYWSQAGWPQPKEINILFIISTSYTNPGYYTFYVSQVKFDDTKPTPIDH